MLNYLNTYIVDERKTLRIRMKFLHFSLPPLTIYRKCRVRR